MAQALAGRHLVTRQGGKGAAAGILDFNYRSGDLPRFWESRLQAKDA